MIRSNVPWRDTKDYVFTAVVALVALLPRLYVAIAWSKEPVWDGHYYHLGAERLAAGLGYSEDAFSQGHLIWKPWVHYPPGYSLLLSVFYFVLGPGLLVAPILNAVLGAAVTAVTHRFGWHFTTPGRAKLAAALVALHPGLIAYSPLVMTEILSTLLLLGAGLAVLTWPGSWRGFLLGGALLGLAVLVRPASLLALPLFALMGAKPWSSALLRTAVAGGVALLFVLP
ncbi:MAG TPA: hypothetical protein VGK73_04170, partial [Polyangiaceae bacterium]